MARVRGRRADRGRSEAPSVSPGPWPGARRPSATTAGVTHGMKRRGASRSADRCTAYLVFRHRSPESQCPSHVRFDSIILPVPSRICTWGKIEKNSHPSRCCRCACRLVAHCCRCSGAGSRNPVGETWCLHGGGGPALRRRTYHCDDVWGDVHRPPALCR